MYRCWYCGEFKNDYEQPRVVILDKVGGATMCPGCFRDYDCAHCGEGFEDESDAVMRGARIMHTGCVKYANAELAADAMRDMWRDER